MSFGVVLANVTVENQSCGHVIGEVPPKRPTPRRWGPIDAGRRGENAKSQESLVWLPALR